MTSAEQGPHPEIVLRTTAWSVLRAGGAGVLLWTAIALAGLLAWRLAGSDAGLLVALAAGSLLVSVLAASPAAAQIRNAPAPRALEFAAYVFAASNVCGYRIDTGPTVLTMPDIIDDAFAAVGDSLAARLPGGSVPPAYLPEISPAASGE